MVQVGGEEEENIADFGGDEATDWVQEDRGSAKRGEEEWRDVPPLFLSPDLRWLQAHLRRGVGLESTGTGTASGGCVQPLVGFVRIDGRLIVVDGPHRSGRRRTLGPVP